jgi:hypothetical protein
MEKLSAGLVDIYKTRLNESLKHIDFLTATPLYGDNSHDEEIHELMLEAKKCIMVARTLLQHRLDKELVAMT